MRMLLLFGLTLALLLAGCVSSKGIEKPSVGEELKEKQEPAQPAVDEEATETPSQEVSEHQTGTEQPEPEEVVGEVNESAGASEEVSESEGITGSRALQAFSSGKMFKCTISYSQEIYGEQYSTTYESWFYYDLASNEKKLKYKGTQTLQDGSVQNIEGYVFSRPYFNNMTEVTEAYSLIDPSQYPQAGNCKYLKVVSSVALDYSDEESYEQNIRAEDSFEYNVFSGSDYQAQTDCQEVPYDPSVFEVKGETCDLATLIGAINAANQ